jgi:NADH:ubiquinone oxidoreductase subunit 4 (subunit M)
MKMGGAKAGRMDVWVCTPRVMWKWCHGNSVFETLNEMLSSQVYYIIFSLFYIRQTDLKSLIAYSSVAHICMVIGGIKTLSYSGVCRSFALIVAHGLCSSIIFCLSNISYENFGRQNLLVNRCLINLMPGLGL